MKVASSNVKMSSSRSSLEVNERTEKLNMWIGSRRPTEPQAPENGRTAALRFIEDRLSLSAEAQRGALTPPAAPPADERKGKGVCCKTNGDDDDRMPSDLKLYLAKILIEAITGKKIKVFDPADLDIGGESPSLDFPEEALQSKRPGEQASEGWGVEYDLKESHFEQEETSFSAEGIIKTEDGKEISFSVELQMSRQFYEESSLSVREGDAAKIDPLVINFDGSAAELTDTRFAFDLDTDGAQENISFVRPGSGFLVLDRNRDGKVNNGSELFGPRTGDGFAELAVYDDDGNNWIDEADSVYADLSVWTKDDAGNDQLSTLQDKNVGAIYLSSVSTPFSLKDSANEALGEVASTGIYAEEDGSVKTVQQVDLVV